MIGTGSLGHCGRGDNGATADVGGPRAAPRGTTPGVVVLELGIDRCAWRRSVAICVSQMFI